MKNTIITKENIGVYRKLLNIKEGKQLANQKCALIPTLILVLGATVCAIITLFNPLVPFKLPLILNLLKLTLFGVGFFGVTKFSVNLSKEMSINEFQKEHSEIDANIDINELKRMLNDYDRNNRYSYYNESVKNITNSICKKELSLEERKEYLIREVEQLKQLGSVEDELDTSKSDNVAKKIGERRN